MSAGADLAPHGAASFAEWRRREPLFAGMTVLCLVACMPVVFALAFDARSHGGESVWVKPLKFLVATIVFFGFFAWAAAWLPEGVRARRWWKVWSAAIVLCAAYELLWIGGYAALGAGSHFNVGTPLAGALFTLAGFGATAMTSAAAVYGYHILRGGGAGLDPAFRRAMIIGFLMTFPLTLIAGFTLAGNGGRYVGEPGSGGFPLFGWSREAGDLRVSHFFALHAMHAVPLLGWAAGRAASGAAALRIVHAGGALWFALTAFTYWQALQGLPFLPFL